MVGSTKTPGCSAREFLNGEYNVSLYVSKLGSVLDLINADEICSSCQALPKKTTDAILIKFGAVQVYRCILMPS